MINRLLISIIILFISSCGSNDPDVIKFKSGSYGSIHGRFLINFPSEPSVSKDHFQLGNVEFDSYNFQYRIASEHIYNVSYVDYPQVILNSWDIEQLFDQNMKTTATQLGGGFRIVKKKVNNTKKYDKSITYRLTSPQPGTLMKATLIKYKDRVYSIFFACQRRQPENQEIDAFLNSFRIYHPEN